MVSTASGPTQVTDAHSLERQEMSRLLSLDLEFVDIVIAFQLQQQHEYELGPKSEAFLKLLQRVLKRKHLLVDASARKRAAAAASAESNYSYDGTRLYRKVYNHDCNEWVERIVITSGGVKSLWFNGRKRPLSLRKRLLMEFHDEEATGAHSSAKDT